MINMGLYYKLDKPLSVEKINRDIHSLMQIASRDQDPTNLILSIEIRTISSETNSLIPKIEYKNSDLTN